MIDLDVIYTVKTMQLFYIWLLNFCIAYLTFFLDWAEKPKKYCLLNLCHSIVFIFL